MHRLDGTVYDTGQVMALHPQDRCSMVPLVEGFPLPTIKPASDWFKSLDEDEQRRMMGDGRYEAWRDGLFDFRQLVTVGNHPVWGPSAHVTSLTDLLKGRGGLGGVAIDPAALLKGHQAAKPAKPRSCRRRWKLTRATRSCWRRLSRIWHRRPLTREPTKPSRAR
ncbi:MAG: hypothetical protein IPJ94_19585 [Chloroflexi bacterium]|nr:hypothetical protein [Chloroflexota bacterium]